MISMVMGGNFRSYIWDPFLIISQILAMQGFYYTTFGIILSVLFLLTPESPNLSHLLDPEHMSLINLENTLVVIASSINSFAVSLALCIVVQRAKLCLDFTCTIHLLNMLLGWAYYGRLMTFSSFIIQIICISIAAVFGEYLCFKYEMKPISLLGNRADL